MGLLEGKRGLILGMANQRSIAYGIAKQTKDQGASLILSYQGPRFEKKVRPLAEELGAIDLLECDVTSDEALEELRLGVERHWKNLDFIVHAVAFAEVNDLKGRFVDTSRAGFLRALEISTYSLVALSRTFMPLLHKATSTASVLTMSYLGAERVVPNYNVMGVAKAALEASVRYLANELGEQNVRVNALSAGPIKTLSAAGVPGLRKMLSSAEGQAPLKRNVSIDDVGASAVYLLSDLSCAVTGEVVHVDSGIHVLAGGLPFFDGS
ncbi:MAG: enoyl-ACP reductase [Myxococcota bacterium]|nr:enoyl-ACP reductase [Myxococcota bacterium]